MSKTDFEDEYPSVKDARDFYFPVVQAEITECSTYAVVCRLKSSPPYKITSSGGSFHLPDYPSVSVIIPKKAVASKTNIPLQIKVSLLAKGCGSEGVVCMSAAFKMRHSNRATEKKVDQSKRKLRTMDVHLFLKQTNEIKASKQQLYINFCNQLKASKSASAEFVLYTFYSIALYILYRFHV